MAANGAGKSEGTDVAASTVQPGGYGPARGEFDPGTFKVDTDTEYDDIDLESYPVCFKVEMSGKSMLNGIYRRMPIKCRGRPTYIMQDKKKTMYFYSSPQGSSKKTYRWVIGADFGGKRSYAKVKEVEDISPPLLPLEPYPHCWLVCFNTGVGKDGENTEKNKEKSTEFREINGMRVAILHEDDTEFPDGELPIVKATFSASSSVAEPGQKSTSKRHKHSSPEDGKKRKHATTAGEASRSSTAADMTDKGQKKDSPAVSSTSVPAASPSRAADKDGAKPAESSDSESESYSSSSCSGGSDSDEPAKAQPPAQKAARTAPAAPSAAAVLAGIAQKRTEWRQQLIEKMKKQAKDDAAKVKGLQQLRALLHDDNKKKKIMEAMPGSSVEDVLAVIDSIEEEFKLPKAIAGNQAAQANTAPVRKGAAVPTKAENHRRAVPRAPAIKKPGQRAPARHIASVYFDDKNNTKEDIKSYKSFGEQLWINQPGFLVYCDGCNQQVEQKQGRLHHSRNEESAASPGSPGLSLFVQDAFYCANCRPIPTTNEQQDQSLYAGSLPGY